VTGFQWRASKFQWKRSRGVGDLLWEVNLEMTDHLPTRFPPLSDGWIIYILEQFPALIKDLLEGLVVPGTEYWFIHTNAPKSRL
jgi:hypothetical protein